MATAHITANQLRESLRMFSATGDELKQKLATAMDVDYWLRLCPSRRIQTQRLPESAWDWNAGPELEDNQIKSAADRYRREGWLSLDHILPPLQLDEMRRCVEAVRSDGWPPVFSYVYDDFWDLGRSPRLRSLLNAILESEYVFLPRVWTHFVYPSLGNSGWKPHIDDSGLTRNVSVWIPLSKSTLSNGCMYVIRRNDATADLSTNFANTDTYTKRQVNALLQAVRALPANPGEILCWDEHVIHWGSQAEPIEGNEPRISIALEFSGPDFPTNKEVPFVISNDEMLPTFRMRLNSICRAILSYRRFEMLTERFVPLAEKILAEPQ